MHVCGSSAAYVWYVRWPEEAVRAPEVELQKVVNYCRDMVYIPLPFTL